MVKCPFCQFSNEDGALFCEQCKSDLSGVEPIAAPAAAVPPPPPPAIPPTAPEPLPVASVVGMEAIPMAHAESIPMAGVVESELPIATAVPLQDPATVPIAGLAMAEPVGAVAGVFAEAPTIPFATEPPAAPPPPPPPVVEAIKVEAPPPPPPPPVSPVQEVVAAPAAPAVTTAPAVATGAKPKLVVMRGQRPNVEYPIYDGHNFIGRADEKPVDIDLEDQEPPERIWSSRQHALITLEDDGSMMIEDLNSSNGTFVNRNKIYPGQKTPLKVNDVIQIGTVQMKVKA